MKSVGLTPPRVLLWMGVQPTSGLETFFGRRFPWVAPRNPPQPRAIFFKPLWGWGLRPEMQPGGNGDFVRLLSAARY
jgi:hypothetical protein